MWKSVGEWQCCGGPTAIKVNSEKANFMSTKGVMATKTAVAGDATQLLKQYGCGPIPLMGTDGLYERHLLFDNIKSVTEISSRERYEAFARSLRDVLSQRWILTQETYQRENPKRIVGTTRVGITKMSRRRARRWT